MELALTVPVLLIVLFGLFEFSLLFFARGSAVEACRAGARKATLPGVNRADIEAEVRSVLKPRFRDAAEIEIEPGQYAGDVVTVSVTVPMNNASPDLLWPIGYSLRDRYIITQARMTRE